MSFHPWVQHVKHYAHVNHCTYGAALRRAAPSYHASKRSLHKWPPPSNENKKRMNKKTYRSSSSELNASTGDSRTHFLSGLLKIVQKYDYDDPGADKFSASKLIEKAAKLAAKNPELKDDIQEYIGACVFDFPIDTQRKEKFVTDFDKLPLQNQMLQFYDDLVNLPSVDCVQSYTNFKRDVASYPNLGYGCGRRRRKR